MKKRNKKILIVENESPVSRTLTAYLIGEGFKVIRAEDENQGLKLAFQKHPDLILIDIFIPKTNGITMLKKLRTDDWGRDVPVIILANSSDIEVLANVLENKIYAFFIKSEWHPEKLVEKIKNRIQAEEYYDL
ncbi:MAG: response regulator [Parcubacteria group bacterium]|nr:response regulator [Parcubacteria group bacterium]